MPDEKNAPGPIPQGDLTNFATLKRAAANNDLAAVSMIRKADNQRVTVLCAMQMQGGGWELMPLATLVEGNPYELFEDPTPGMEGT